MIIEITDIPNNQLIKNIKLDMQFSDGQVQSFTQTIDEISKDSQLPTDISNREAKIPEEMTDIQF